MDVWTYLPGFIAAYSILFVAASSPGPAVAMLLGISLTQGRRAALTASVGIASGSVVLNVLTLLGVGLLLSQVAWTMTILRVLGGAYLLYLAWGAFRKALHPPAVAAAEVPTQSFARLFAAGFLLQVTNPKAIVFWIAINAIGATTGGGPVAIAIYLFGAFLISFACHGAWGILLSAGQFRRLYARARRGVEATLGVFFAFAAFKLVTSRS